MGINLFRFFRSFSLNRLELSEILLNLLSHLYIRIYLIALICINSLIWLLSYIINIQHINHELIILHYNINFGVNLIGNAKKIYIAPILGLIISVNNLFVLLGIYKFGQDKKFFGHLLLASTVISNLLLLMAIISLYLINSR